MTAAVRRVLATSRSEFDPRKYLAAATSAAQAVCRDRFIAFGCAGQAAKIRPLALDAMARSEEHTSELQSLLRRSYAVFCLKKKKQITQRIRIASTQLPTTI